MADRPVYTLHYFPFSLYSLMIRFAIVLSAEINPETTPDVVYRFVNRQKLDNLTEEYLYTVNPKGSVPALTSPWLASPIRDSHDISKWLCKEQPGLAPTEYMETITRIRSLIYEFHATVLNITIEDRPNGVANEAAALLERSNISEAHRRALEIKSIYHDTFHQHTLDRENILDIEQKTRSLLSEVSVLLEQHREGGMWIFGEKPTILDAHVVPLVLRLIHKQRDELIKDENVRVYAETVEASPQWEQVTAGRKTVWQPSYGPADKMLPLW